jgi:hypothetical protein
VFFSPTDLFRRRGNDTIAAPLITLLILATAFYYILLPAQGIVMRAAMANMDPEKAAQMPEGMTGIMSLMGGIAVPFKYAITIFITAFLLWGIARLVDAKPAYRQMVIVATYAGFIALLGQIASSLMVMMQGDEGFNLMKMTFSPLRFMDPEKTPGALMGLLGRIDIFKIWEAVIWMIGFQVVTGVTRSKAALVAGATWLLWGLPGILGGNAMKDAGAIKVTE